MVPSHPRPLVYTLTGAVFVALLVSAPSAQQPYLHLNPVVEKLSQGKHVFGVSTSDLSLQNARSLARDPDIDYVYLDMEHNAMRFDQLEIFLSGMTDKAGILQRGNGQAHPAVFARFAPYGSENAQWVVKHALDLGLMGVLINNVETVQQAENVVRTMRYMPQRDSRIPTPRGVRGTAGNAPWFWGISGTEYRRRADLWPLNPQGDLLFWPMIETVEGVNNADAIAQVPGVGGFYLGAGGDLSNSLGVPDSTHPDVNAAIERDSGRLPDTSSPVWRDRQCGECGGKDEARLPDHQLRRCQRWTERAERSRA